MSRMRTKRRTAGQARDVGLHCARGGGWNRSSFPRRTSNPAALGTWSNRAKTLGSRFHGNDGAWRASACRARARAIIRVGSPGPIAPAEETDPSSETAMHRSLRRADARASAGTCPSDFNIARRVPALGGRRRRPRRGPSPADGSRRRWTYRALRDAADRIWRARCVRARRASAVTAIAIVLPQCAETAIAHHGDPSDSAPIAMPLSLLFGPEALEFRLQDSGAVIAIVACVGASQPFVDAATAACDAACPRAARN